jgi:hypothetical protein
MQSTYAPGTPALSLPRSGNIQSYLHCREARWLAEAFMACNDPEGWERAASDCWVSTGH